jgi:hypothetical protein
LCQNSATKLPDSATRVPRGTGARWSIIRIAGKQAPKLGGFIGKSCRHGNEIEASVERCGKQKRKTFADRQCIFGAPGLRVVPQQAKFPRQALPTVLNVPVDAIAVGVKAKRVVFLQKFQGCRGRGANTDESDEIIEINGRPIAKMARELTPWQGEVTKNFCHAAAQKAPIHVHLPKPLLSVQISLREEQIMLIEGGHVGNGVLIPEHFDRSPQAGQAQFSFMNGQSVTVEKVDQ